MKRTRIGTASTGGAACPTAGHIYKCGARKKEAHKHRAAVAHKNRCGVGVVDEKSQQRTAKCYQHISFNELTCVDEANSKKSRCNYGDA
jgi:hypothetical protein